MEIRKHYKLVGFGIYWADHSCVSVSNPAGLKLHTLVVRFWRWQFSVMFNI